MAEDNRAEVRLLADAMLGRLARWLRALGYETLYDSRMDDAALARLARAQGRLLLTRDHQLAARQGLQTVLVRSDNLSDQLSQVLSLLPSPPAKPFGRCVACNGVLEEVDRPSVAARVPEHVWETQSEFALCRGCGRIYWRGTHWDHIRQHLAALGLRLP